MSSINWSVPPPTYDDHSMTTTLTPYLQLPHLLSLTWLAYPVISLLFVAFRLQLSLASAEGDIASAKNDLLAGCSAAERAATTAASLPRYMALATNQQFADAVNGSMRVASSALINALTVMELVVRAGLAIVIAAVQEFNTVIQGVASSLTTTIQDSINNANTIITNAISSINKVNPFGNITPPQITVPSLDSLQNLTLPASFQQALTNLNSSIPSVADIKSKLNDFIDTPFELLKQDINNTFSNLTFDATLLPVPDENRLSFCNGLDTSVIDDIGRDLAKIAEIGVIILVVLALLLTGLNCLFVWYKWRCMKINLETTRQAWMSDPTLVYTKSSSAPQITLSDHNLMTLRVTSEHPLIAKYTNLLATRTGMTPSQHINIRWFFHYVFHPPALACFLIGFFGLLSVEVQLLALGPVVSTARAMTAAAVSDFSNTIANSINQSMYNQSSFYANEINAQVNTVQTTINNGVFGWVNGTTTTLNTTINDFYTEIQNLVATVFNGTILEAPANEFLQCFIGNKVADVEDALTFLHNNLIVNIPRVNDDILVLSPHSVNEATAPIAAAAVGGGSNNDQGILGRLVASYETSLKKERVMFSIFMGLWGIVVFMAICVILWHSYGKPYMHRRGRRRWEREQRAGMMTVGQIGSQDFKYPGDEKREFRSFTPLPSPRGSVFKPFWPSRSNSPINGSPSTSVEPVVQKDFHRNNTLHQSTTSLPSPQKRAAKLLSIGRRAIGLERLKKDGEVEDATPPVINDSSMEEYHRSTPWYTRMTGLMTRKQNQQNPVQENKDNVWDSSATTRKEREPPKLQIYTEKGLLAHHDHTSSYRQQEDDHLTHSRWSSSPDANQTSWMRIMSPNKKPSAFSTLLSPPPVTIMSTPNSPPIRPNADTPVNVDPVYEDPTAIMPRHKNPTTMRMEPILPIPLYNSFERSQMQTTQPLFIRQNLPSPPRHPRQNQESPRIYEHQNPLTSPPDRHRRSTSIRTPSQQWRVTNGAPSDLSSLSSTSSVAVDMAVTPVTRLLTATHGRNSSSVVNPFITPFDDEHRVKIENSPEHMRKSMQTSSFGVAL